MVAHAGYRQHKEVIKKLAADGLSAVEIMAAKRKRNETVKKVFIVWFGSNALSAAGYFARILSENAFYPELFFLEFGIDGIIPVYLVGSGLSQISPTFFGSL